MTRSERDLAARLRREPPRFRTAEVSHVEPLTPRMMRVTLAGPELHGLRIEDPAASVRGLLPSPGASGLVIPTWNGNEFLLPDGSRPIIRTFTPYRVDPESFELELWVVLHDTGAASEWASTTKPGDAVAISGPGRGYAVDPDASSFVLAGDETAVPAISQLLEQLPPGPPIEVLIEVAHPDARLPLPEHPNATVSWLDLPGGSAPGDALVDAVATAAIDPGARVWAAGEAAAVQRIRKQLFGVREHPRSQTTVRGYWKHGRRGDASE